MAASDAVAAEAAAATTVDGGGGGGWREVGGAGADVDRGGATDIVVGGVARRPVSGPGSVRALELADGGGGGGGGGMPTRAAALQSGAGRIVPGGATAAGDEVVPDTVTGAPAVCAIISGIR